MRIGVLLIPTDPWQASLARARHLEDLGFDHLWTYDHLSWRRYRDRPWFGAIPWLTGVAAGTSRIRVGTMVTSPNFRHPVTLAKDAMTLDHVSGGRLTLGIGAGGIGFDATVFGEAPLTPGQRATRLDDFVRTLDGLLRHGEFSGSTPSYTVQDARMLPGCVQQPRLPFAIAAGGRRTMSVAAHFGDAWITDGAADPDESSAMVIEAGLRRQLNMLAVACAQAGRDPDSLDRILLLGNNAQRPLANPAAFADVVGSAAAMGFTDIVLHDPRPEDPVWNDDPAVVEAIAAQFLDQR